MGVARSPRLADAVFERVTARAASQGFDVSRLMKVEQS
jgi:lipocalin